MVDSVTPQSILQERVSKFFAKFSLSYEKRELRGSVGEGDG